MVTCKESGVDIDAAGAAVEKIARHVQSTYGPRVLAGSHGGSAGLFHLDYPPGILARNYRHPVLAACTRGVGTKLEIAIRLGICDTVGIDLVAMCVNDLVAQGAEPLFFLDRIAAGKLDPSLAVDLVKGIARGCVEAGCAILGGETADVPGFYAAGHYDLAGFSVGVAERTRLVTGRGVCPGDQVLGLLSSGVHSSGCSLARRIVLGRSKGRKALDEPLPGSAISLGEELLTPTRIYTRPILAVLRHYRQKKVVKAMAHITGGGLPGSVSRVIPQSIDVVVDRSLWQVPEIFRILQSRGDVAEEEMFRVFNMGIGMVMIVAPFYADSIIEQLGRLDVEAVRIGEAVEGSGRLQLR
ncbi:MAG: phosphoribosylformylglycinamidine cyclo-ligase [Planctomycetes bacterium]|nr:phosphoribosylformylglycinamidine cyclo-ligase [Planctomycetota bacterium]